MTQDDQNVAEKRDKSSTEQDTTPTDSNLNDLVGRSRQATREADEALRNAGQGGQPGDQPIQEKGQQGTNEADGSQQGTADQDTKNKAGNVGVETDREATSGVGDPIADPNAAQGSASDGDSAG